MRRPRPRAEKDQWRARHRSHLFDARGRRPLPDRDARRRGRDRPAHTRARPRVRRLDGLDEIKVCTGYRLKGKECDSFPAVSHELREVEPVYETLPGWNASTEGVTELERLPARARDYVEFISGQIGVPAGLVSTGPERSQTILVRDSALAR